MYPSPVLCMRLHICYSITLQQEHWVANFRYAPNLPLVRNVCVEPFYLNAQLHHIVVMNYDDVNSTVGPPKLQLEVIQILRWMLGKYFSLVRLTGDTLSEWTSFASARFECFDFFDMCTRTLTHVRVGRTLTPLERTECLGADRQRAQTH